MNEVNYTQFLSANHSLIIARLKSSLKEINQIQLYFSMPVWAPLFISDKGVCKECENVSGKILPEKKLNF